MKKEKAGGVKLCKGNEDVIETVDKMIGMKIITPQTTEQRKNCKTSLP